MLPTDSRRISALRTASPGVPRSTARSKRRSTVASRSADRRPPGRAGTPPAQSGRAPAALQQQDPIENRGAKPTFSNTGPAAAAARLAQADDRPAWPPWNAKTARSGAKPGRDDRERGRSAADRGARAAAPTVADLAERFLAEHAERNARRRPRRNNRGFLHFALPVLVAKLADITRRDIERLHHTRRDTPTEANRALACLSAMFNIAERWGLRLVAQILSPYREVPYRDGASASCRRQSWRGSETLSRPMKGGLQRGCGKLLVFTGARPRRGPRAALEIIDFERGEARLPTARAARRLCTCPRPPSPSWLGAAVGGQPARHRRRESGCSARRPRKAVAVDSQSRRPRRCSAARFRHAFASVAASSGTGLPIIGKMLGHTQAATIDAMRISRAIL